METPLSSLPPTKPSSAYASWGSMLQKLPKAANSLANPYGKEAEAYLKSLVEGKQVRVEIDGVDRYYRILATLLLAESEGRRYHTKNINLAMIEAGLAEGYRGPDSGDPYKTHTRLRKLRPSKLNGACGFWETNTRAPATTAIFT